MSIHDGVFERLARRPNSLGTRLRVAIDQVPSLSPDLRKAVIARGGDFFDRNAAWNSGAAELLRGRHPYERAWGVGVLLEEIVRNSDGVGRLVWGVEKEAVRRALGMLEDSYKTRDPRRQDIRVLSQNVDLLIALRQSLND